MTEKRQELMSCVTDTPGNLIYPGNRIQGKPMRGPNWTGSLPARPRPAHGIFLTEIVDLQNSRPGVNNA